MPEQPEYLVRGRSLSQTRIVQSTTPFVQHKAVHRPTGKSIGGFTEVAVAGVDRKNVVVASRDTVYADGRGGQGVRAHVAKTAAGLKTAVRRLRPQEAERLDEIDAEIRALREAITALQAARKNVVAEAWAKAHVVRLNEITLASDPTLRAK
jgi:hypothetical protein